MSSRTVSTPAASAETRERSSVSEADSALGHEDAEHALGPEGPRAEEGDEARVDAAREADDGAATPQVLVDDLAQALGDLVRRPPRIVQAERLRGQLLSRHRWSRRSSRRRSG